MDSGSKNTTPKKNVDQSSPGTDSKLDDVTDAPEAGEPREQGRSHGHIIDADGTIPTKPTGDTTDDAWESGRQDAVE